jgi:hypothetical protein
VRQFGPTFSAHNSTHLAIVQLVKQLALYRGGGSNHVGQGLLCVLIALGALGANAIHLVVEMAQRHLLLSWITCSGRQQGSTPNS